MYALFYYPPPPRLDKKRVAVKSFYCNIERPKIQDKNATIVVQTPRSIYIVSGATGNTPLDYRLSCLLAASLFSVRVLDTLVCLYSSLDLSNF